MDELKIHELKILEVSKTYQITIRNETGIGLLTKRWGGGGGKRYGFQMERV